MGSLERRLQHLAAIVEDSDDAIITKDLDSIIQSWNRGAESLFGYTAEEAIGQPITLIFPQGRQDEEAGIIEKIRRGQRIAHFETMRRRKDGGLVPISVTISPMHDGSGRVVGASKIARDISLKREIEEQQHMLLSEMRHRVRNCFAVAGGLLRICARQADSIEELLDMMQNRFQALSRAHDLAVPLPDPDEKKSADVNLHEFVSSILTPFIGGTEPRIAIENCRVADAAITPLALVFYELCTNSVKYGGLSTPRGDLVITSEREGDRLRILWSETCEIDDFGKAEDHEGFGTKMAQTAIAAYLDGTLTRSFTPTGLRAVLDLNYERVTDAQRTVSAASDADNAVSDA
ncbi:PAS domain S-box protein [Roseovarius spongiae]|nr:PAS domain S-box protein [Roseovarius spongiae]